MRCIRARRKRCAYVITAGNSPSCIPLLFIKHRRASIYQRAPETPSVRETGEEVPGREGEMEERGVLREGGAYAGRVRGSQGWIEETFYF